MALARSICSSPVKPSSASSTSAPRLESSSRRMRRLLKLSSITSARTPLSIAVTGGSFSAGASVCSWKCAVK